jgi:outer membrane protein assembly factor BamB
MKLMNFVKLSMGRSGLATLAAGMAVLVNHGSLAENSWPQWLGEGRDAILDGPVLEVDLEANPLILEWESGLGGGYAGPAIAGNLVLVTDWKPTSREDVPGDPFQRGRIPGRESLYCFNLETGAENWKTSWEAEYSISYPAGPRCTPLFSEGIVYALGSEGHLVAVDSGDGRILWKKNFRTEMGATTPEWGFAGHPLAWKDLVICVTGGSEGRGVAAFDRHSGEVRWSSMTLGHPGYCPPTIIHRHGKEELLIWSGVGIHGLDPATGTVQWSIDWELRFGLAVATPRQVGDRLFFTSFYNGSLLLSLEPEGDPRVVWKTVKPSEKDTVYLHSIMSTPMIDGDYVYGVCSYGQLRCLRIDDGERIWESMAATTGGPEERWANAFIIRNGTGSHRYFLFNESGDLIDCRLTPGGFEELGRMNLVRPDGSDMRRRPIVWSHPALTDKHLAVRNDSMIRLYRFPELSR